MVLADRDVIEKEHRRRTLHEHIIDAHGDRVDTDGIVLVSFKRDHQLCATPSVPLTSTGSLNP